MKKRISNIVLNIIILLVKITLAIEILGFCFLNSSYAEINVTLTWEANTDPDLAGYILYYKTGSPGPPYTDQNRIDNPKATTYTVHNLSSTETYYFVLTAYDTSGLESYYSNEESVSLIEIEVCDGDDNDCDGQVVIFIIDLKYGRNKVLYQACCHYTSFNLLLNFKNLGDTFNLHYQNPHSGSFNSSYWFFDRLSGKKIELPIITSFEKGTDLFIDKVE